MSDEDIFGHEDDKVPATRGDLRRLDKKLRWYVVLAGVGGTTLSHVDLPSTAGFAGAGLVVAIGLIKVAFTRF